MPRRSEPASVLSASAGARLRIALIAPARSPVAQPFAGGLEAHVWTLAHALRARGHVVTLFAGPGTDPALHPVELELATTWLSLDARRDVSMQPDVVVGEHHAYLSLMLGLARSRAFDVVHNHSVHYLPIAMADTLDVPVLTTLHTPPTPWLESAIRAGRGDRHPFVAVSHHTAGAWGHVLPDLVTVPNGVDTAAWPAGPGGNSLVWSGRIVAEKGVHLAVAAARLAGLPLSIAGPIVDRRYFDERVRPDLGRDIRYVGHLDQPRLSELVRNSGVAVVTPDWDEPYGLVVAEALASATPVAAFGRGGIPEIVDTSCARLAPSGDVRALAEAITQARTLDRSAARRRAESHCSVEAMIDRYEQLLDGLARRRAA